jgi:hypothetical protein
MSSLAKGAAVGFGIAIGGVILFLTGAGLNSAGIYYVAADWGSSEASDKARLYSLLIAGIIVMALGVALMAYWLFSKPKASTTAGANGIPNIPGLTGPSTGKGKQPAPALPYGIPPAMRPY